MFENTIPAQSIVRQPRGIVTVNGITAAFIRAEVNNTTNFLADTFSLELPISGQPSQLSMQYFASESAIMIEVFIGFPPDPSNYTKEQLDIMITGQVDDVEIDLLERKYILTGRDLTAKFIDNKTTNKYPNLTSSQIVTMLAEKEGLTPDVTPTSTPAGTYYAGDRAALTAELPEWDLITFLAQQEDFSAYVEGTTLHFHPAPTEKDKAYLLQYQDNENDPEKGYTAFNGNNLKLSRSLTVARDIIVIVRSWNSKSKKAFNVRVKATPNKKTALASKAQPIGDAQTFTYVKPGFTKEQALQFAQQQIKNLSQHERKIEAELPGDNILKKVGVVRLKGTNTDYDQVYFTSSVNRVLSPTQYSMTVEAKNHSPNSQAVF